MPNKIKVSVIIPFYNVEAFLESCASSLFEQSLEEIEFIFVNDCSTDNSLQKLKNVITRYPHRADQIKLVDHSQNKGISASRNSGLAQATGEYIAFCDSDDWVESTMYEKMYIHARQQDLDLVWSDYIIEAPFEQSLQVQQGSTSTEVCIKALLTGKNMSPYLWNKMTKRQIFLENDLWFPEGINIREDFLMVIKLFFYADKVQRIPQAFYHYRKRPDSITHLGTQFNEDPSRINNRVLATEMIADFIKSTGSGSLYTPELMACKLKLKRIILANSMECEKWVSLFPEANPFISKANLTFGTKCWMYAASFNWSGAVKLLKWSRQVKNSLTTV